MPKPHTKTSITHSCLCQKWFKSKCFLIPSLVRMFKPGTTWSHNSQNYEAKLLWCLPALCLTVSRVIASLLSLTLYSEGLEAKNKYINKTILQMVSSHLNYCTVTDIYPTRGQSSLLEGWKSLCIQMI